MRKIKKDPEDLIIDEVPENMTFCECVKKHIKCFEYLGEEFRRIDAPWVKLKQPYFSIYFDSFKKQLNEMPAKDFFEYFWKLPKCETHEFTWAKLIENKENYDFRLCHTHYNDAPGKREVFISLYSGKSDELPKPPRKNNPYETDDDINFIPEFLKAF